MTDFIKNKLNREKTYQTENNPMNQNQPSAAFVMAGWAALLTGILTYLIGLWNADMELSSKGYYFTILMFGLFGAVSVQKSVRDKLDNIHVTNIYYCLLYTSPSPRDS